MKKYALIATQFMIFALTLDSKDIPRFLEFRFEEESFETNSKQSKSSTIRVYYAYKKVPVYFI